MNRLVAVPAVGRREVHAFTATDWTRSEQLFRRAARHSRLIRILRVVVPIGAVASCAVLAGIAYFNPFKTPDLALDKGTLVVTGRKVAMEQPRLSGYTKDLLPYELTARLASQDLSHPGVLELNDLKAHVQTKDQGKINISAKTGVYTVKADQLQLVDNILVRTSLGYEAHLEQALIDMKKGTIVSDRPVKAKFPQGTIASNRLDVSESGSVILFSQGVKTVFVLPKQPSAAAKAASP
jgi:lipopolysaccharide export system protein LptC